MRRSIAVYVTLLLAAGLVLATGTTLGSAQEQGVGQPQQEALPSPLTVTEGACTVNKIRVKTSNTSEATISASFVNVPSMSVSLTVGGTSKTCLKVEFTASVKTNPGGGMMVRALLDGATVGFPAQVWFVGDETFYGAHAFSWVFYGVAPGSHTVSIQWSSPGGSFYVQAWWRTLTVDYQ